MNPCTPTRHGQSGVLLLEAMIALALLIVISVGLMCASLVVIATTENQGHLAARTAEYAQDKMEQLMSLAYCDTQTDTTVFPANPRGGTGLGATASCPTPSSRVSAGSTVFGSNDTSHPITGYVDYLDQSGNVSSASANWFYIRAWQISTPSGTTNLKQITVTTTANTDVGPSGSFPTATVIAYKSYPF